MSPDLFMQTILYVINAPLFWASMGMTTAIAMFIGAMIYDGQLTEVRKGILTIGSYVFMLLWMTISRIFNMIDSTPNRISEMTFAGTLSIVFVSIAWTLGVFLGVLIFNLRYKGKHLK